MSETPSQDHLQTTFSHRPLWKLLSNQPSHDFLMRLCERFGGLKILVQSSDISEPEHDQCVIADVLLQAQERERQRIANDLHDSIGQSLTSVKMGIELVLRDMQDDSGQNFQRNALIGLLSQLSISIEELRRIALDLRPAMLDELGLLATLEEACREFCVGHPGIHLMKQVELEEGDVPVMLRCDLYRLMQEALHNVAKHASADEVGIRLGKEEETLTLSITDNGCGFEPGNCRNTGLGLNSMKARCQRTGGSMYIHSSEGSGTEVGFLWYLPEIMEKDTQGKE